MKTPAVVLSPVNFFGMAKQISQPQDSSERDDRRIEEVVLYRCPECGELHDWESDARKCCEPPANGADPSACPVCGEHFESYRNAADCCLWKDIDAPTRWKIADAVQAGSDWATELGLITTGAPLAKAVHQ